MTTKAKSPTIQMTEAERRAAGLLTIKLRLSHEYTRKFEAIAHPGEEPPATLRRLIDAEFAGKTRARKNRQGTPK